MSRRVGVGARAAACAAATVLGACMASAPGTAPRSPDNEKAGDFGGGAAATEEPDAATPTVGDELESLSAQVDQSWLELEALDDARAKAAAGGAEPGDEGVARCTRIRGLADEICTLSDRMCTLATEHPGQARYAEACTRSGETCSRARAAAERCPAG